MRPGSPVKPLVVERPSFVTPDAYFAAAQPAVKVVAVPATVWVALAVFTRAVAVNNRVADQPVSGGRQGIFARPVVQMEERLNCQVLAVTAARADADAAVAAHRAANPALAAEYSVSEHQVGAVPAAPQTEAAPHGCIDCGTPIAAALTRCQPCQTRYWESCREVDPEL